MERLQTNYKNGATMNLLSRVKDAGQDFEWYPTTTEMLQVVADRINASEHGVSDYYLNDFNGILDIGAGDGRALLFFRDRCECARELMAIEKSSILAQEWSADIFPVGCDFKTQSLMDKPVRAIFCNPPYSEYEQWACKIIREGFFWGAYLVIPQRWKDSAEIVQALEDRGMKADVIWSGSFHNAERAARAVVNIVHLHHRQVRGGTSDKDPFAAWFDSQFKFAENNGFEEAHGDTLRDKALLSGRNLIEALETLYHDELSRLYGSYTAITALDVQTLKDIGVEKEAIRSALREKIKGLKNRYWKELFNNLDRVTCRLTSKSRDAMLRTLMASTNVDFDASNAYTVLMWVVKNANKYFDQQLVEVFKALTCQKSAIPYKSNIHWQDGSWRSMSGWDIHEGRGGKYALDYRFILEGRFYESGWESNRRRSTLLQDICTIANNLGFEGIAHTDLLSEKWNPGEWHEATFKGGTLFTAKAYMNGNLHLKFHKELMGRLNVEAGRLLGWLTSQVQASREMGDNAASGAWRSSFALDMSGVFALTA